MSDPKTVGLAAPWTTLYKMIYVMFKEDPEVVVDFVDQDGIKNIKIRVSNLEKAEAIEKILPSSRVYGNITVYITVIPPNGLTANMTSVYETAFKGNPALSYIHTSDNKGLYTMNYVVFKNKVVQFFNDELDDINGLRSTLYQNIANEIFENRDGVCFCTDVPEDEKAVGAPLGEWP
jgi:hypothetical protein